MSEKEDLKEDKATRGKARVVRLGIIGAGLATRHLHWPPLRRLRETIEVTYVADISPEAARKVAGMAGGCAWTHDYRDVLTSPDVDAVLVSVPIHLNAQMIMESADAGKHVFCEKPVASNLEQAHEVVAAVHDASVVVAIAEQFHFRRDLELARRWVDEGCIGTLFMINASCHYWNDITKGFAATPWRNDSQYRGGAITDVCVHHAAMLRVLGGEVEQLQAFTKLVHPAMSGVDTMVLNLRYRSGVLGSYLFTDAAVKSDSPFVNATLFGTEGTIWLKDGLVRMKRRDEEDEMREKFDTSEAHYDQLVNFHDAIVGRAEVRVTAEEAMRDLEILMRAYDSAESHRVVLLA